MTRLRSAAAPMLVAAAAGLAFTWHLVLSLRRAEGLTSGAFDQAYFQQLVWSLSQGHGLRSSFNPGEFLGLHFSPLLALPALLQPLWPDARLLGLLQAAALAALAPAAYLFLRALLRPAREATWLAAALALPIPFWAVAQQATRASFHTEALALPLILVAGWAGLTGRTAILFGAALMALGAKEDQVYPVAVMGLLVAARAPGPLSSAMRRAGLVMAGLAAAWAVATFGLLMPALRAGAAYDIDGYYAWLGGGLNVLRAPFEQTDAVLAALTRPEGWLVVIGLVLSMAALPLLRPRWALLMLPPTVAHLLSRHEPQPQLLLQYGLLLVVPAIVAGGLGARRLLALSLRYRRRRAVHGRTASSASRRIPPSGGRRARAGWPRTGTALMVTALVVSGFGIAVARGGIPPFSSREERAWNRPAALTRLISATAIIPADAPIAADSGVAAPLANRKRIEVFPTAGADAFVVVDREAYVPGRLRWRDRAAWLDDLTRSGRRLLIDDGRFQVWAPLDE
ncbi:MAG: DUF2079 domain-containing protein [Chloroflexota bacterium]|nr:DUF2079 domain-containing protein [Chloroflexota bacterium]